MPRSYIIAFGQQLNQSVVVSLLRKFYTQIDIKSMTQVTLGLPKKRLGKWATAGIKQGSCAFCPKLLPDLDKGGFHVVLIRDVDLVGNSGASVSLNL